MPIRAARGRFVAGSLALHTLLLVLAAARQPPTRLLPHRTLAETALEIEVVGEPPAVAPLPSRDSSPSPASREGRGGRSEPRVAPTIPMVDAASPPSDAGELVGPAAPDEPVRAVAPGLSLAQLGVAGPNPFLDRSDAARDRTAKADAVKRRLDRALSQGLTDADRQRGLGAGGPVLRAMEAAVYASTVPLNGQASFVFVIDASGKLLSATLGDATGDRSTWLRVAQQTVKSLGKIPALKRRQGVKLTVAVTSHLELPSGRDPGLEISAQGAPLKKGGGPRSTRLDLSIFPFPAATLAGDPADIGARPRRMVHAIVVGEELL